ncbi:MAG: hypothetical protein PUE61_01495 [Clostridiales bacterium]|nr:hypothetical protein [Clostridiales bacterium]
MKKWLAFLLVLMLLPLSGLAESGEYSDHLVFQSVNLGSCRELTGDVAIQVVFVDGDEGAWDEKNMAEYKIAMGQAYDQLTRWGRDYGQEVRISLRYAHTAESMDLDFLDSDAWADHVMNNADLPARGDDSVYMQECMPIIFLLNEGGRAYACANASETYNDYLICFNNSTVSSFSHELLHLYGAVDYYYPLAYQEAAQKYFPQSIMFTTEEHKEFDGLTAYIIGWTDTLDENARAFLADTRHIRKEDLENAQEDTLFTGYATQVKEYYTYTGEWVMGAWEGNGILEWTNGARYEGEFSGGLRHGRGVMTLSNGETYIGEYREDRKHGQGVETWADLSVYTGAYEQDMRHGYGTQVWADGTVYRGDWLNGQMTGQGTYLWPDGSYYHGGMVNGGLNGYGIFVDAAGNLYRGNWVNGNLAAE